MNRTSNSEGIENFAYGFLTGGLIIGSLALLFAPKKGTRLRKDIRKDIFNAKKDLMNTAENYLNSAGDYLNVAKEKAEDFIADGTHKITTLLDDSSDAKILQKADDLITHGKGKLNKLNNLIDSADHKVKDKHKKHG